MSFFRQVAWGEILPAASAALAFLLIAGFLGARLRQLFRNPLPPSLRLPADVLAGLWTMAAAFWLLAMVRQLSRTSLAAVLLLAALAGRFRGAGWSLQTLSAPALAGAVLLPMALAPPFFYDALVYHLGLPWQALLEGGFFPHPENVFATFPPLAQLVALPFLAFGLPRGVGVVHLSMFVLAGAVVAALAKRAGAKRRGAIAAFALVLVPIYVLVPALPAAEGYGVLAVSLLLAPLLYSRLAPFVLGFWAGFAVAARLQALPFAALTLLLGVRNRRALVGVAASALVAASLWWAKNAVLLGNPLLPVGWGGPGIEAFNRDSVRVLAMGGSYWDALAAVARTLLPHASYLAPLLLSGVLASLGPGPRVCGKLALLVLLGLPVWAYLGLVTRYLAAWVPPLLLWTALGRSNAARVGSSLALVTAAALGLAVSLRELGRWGGPQLFGGTGVAEREFVFANPFPAFAAARVLPPEAKVLFVGEARGYGFPRRFVAPSYLDLHPLASLLAAGSDGEVREKLRQAGFTHLLVNWAELRRLTQGYPCAPWPQPHGESRFLAFVGSLGPPRIAMAPVAVYELAGGD